MADLSKELVKQTNAVHRLLKDIGMYEKEKVEFAEKIRTLEQENKEDVRQWRSCLEDAEAVIPDCMKRLEHHAGELESFLKKAQLLGDVSYEVDAAEKTLEQAVTLLNA